MRVQQLVQFGQLLVLGQEGPARLHASAALRHGASLDDLLGVVETAFVTAGVPASRSASGCSTSCDDAIARDRAVAVLLVAFDLASRSSRSGR